MKKKKRLRTFLIVVLVLALLGTGGYFGGSYYIKSRAQSVEVLPVSVLNAADWIQYYNETSTYGTVVSDLSQQVYIPSDKVVNEVFVSQGDKVKVGDKLLDYDTTLLELDLELQDLTVQEIDLEIESAQADLKKLKNTTPVAKSQRETSELFGPDQELPGGDWDDDTFAGMIPSGRKVTASQEGAAQTEAAQTEELPQTDSAQNPASEAQAAEPASQGTETGAQSDQPQTAPEEEVEQLITENTADGTLPELTDRTEDFFADESQKPKMNQSLLKLLSHVSAQEPGSDEEKVLLADTRDQKDDTPVTASLPPEGMELVLHFQESADAHFEKWDTYAMLVRGVTLKEDKAGIVYCAAGQGEEPFEIGGFTAVQDPERSDVVYLTLAFHSGLEERHAVLPELEDVYVQIRLLAEELSAEKLTFRTAKKENDVTMCVARQEDGETETGSEGTEQTSENTSETESEPSGAEPESEPSSAEEAQPGGETETETESETEPEPEIPVSNVIFDIIWYHGTNASANWPRYVDIDFYDPDDADQENSLWTAAITGSTDIPADETEDPNGEEEPATETEMEMWDEDPDFESVDDFDSWPEDDEDWQQQMGDLENMGPDGEEAQPGSVTHIIQTEDNSFSKVHWRSSAMSWSDQLSRPESYTMVVSPRGSINYIPRVEWSSTDESGMRVCRITMTYLEPQESPLIKLEPLSELDFWTGEGGRYYKGSGTMDDPYVFFCTDGAMIQSSFVNWVLGFNEDGTERILEDDGTERMGFYVVLEIRESDTITGAFIRSVGLDGTDRTEYGYGPGTYWIFSSDSGIVRFEEEIDDPIEDFDDPGWYDMGDTYTAEELSAAISEKEREIRRLDLNKREAEMKLRQYEKDLENSTVVSAVDGYVETVNGDTSGSRAYMVVTSEGGLYLQTTVGEMDLDTVQKGDILTATSWQTQREFSASITQIDYYPTEGQNMYGNGNPNSSSYPVIARIEDSKGLTPYEMVEVKFAAKTQGEKGIYIPTPYIRSENGQSYVYKRGSDELLTKQYVRTGATINDQVEIKEGLTTEDFIAFPYGKSVKEGAKTEESQDIYY